MNNMDVSQVPDDEGFTEKISPDLALKLLRQWIIDALEKKKVGESDQYLALLKELDIIFEDEAQLRIFSQCVSSFDLKAHETLVMQLLGTSLWNCSGGIGDVILEFVINLVAVNSGTIHHCLEMLVRNFLPPCCGIPAFMGAVRSHGLTGVAAIMKAREQREDQMSRKDEVLEKVHNSLQKVLELVPTALAWIQPIILERMPHKLVQKEFQCLYLEGIFRLALSKTGGALQDQLLSAVVDRLIMIDVEIRWEDILQQEEDGKKGKVYLFHMDLDDESDDECAPEDNLTNEMSTPGSEVAPQNSLIGRKGLPVPTLDEMADKMDALMCLTFAHLKDRVDRGEVREVFDALVRSFQSTVLETHKSKFTQFLLFYLGSLSPTSCAPSFANLLCDIITSPSRSASVRMSAAAYLASYLARAKFLPFSAITASLTRVAHWCLDYVEAEDRRRSLSQSDSRFSLLSLQESQMRNKLSPHAVFYCTCQAVLYVLCYRLHALISDAGSEPLVRALPLERLLSHPLNPLAACLDSVALEFERQAKACRLLDIRPIRERHLANFQLPFVNFGGVRSLETFFPFDPYLLRQSNRYIKPIFLKWVQPTFEDQSEGSATDDGEDSQKEREEANEEEDESLFGDGTDAEDASEASSEELENVPERMGMSYSDRSQALPSSMEEMAGTPPIRRFGETTLSVPISGGAMETSGRGFEPRSLEMGSYTSDEMGVSLTKSPFSDLMAMADTPPSSHLPPKLPARLPPRLPPRFRK